MKRLWILIRTLPARIRAHRARVAFVDCPVCHEPFSFLDIAGIEFPETLNYSPTEGRLVCAKPDCQLAARTRNRLAYGRSRFDPWPVGLRIEYWTCPNPQCQTVNNTTFYCSKCRHPKPGASDFTLT